MAVTLPQLPAKLPEAGKGDARQQAANMMKAGSNGNNGNNGKHHHVPTCEIGRIIA